jgi:uncharacterized protein YcfJ
MTKMMIFLVSLVLVVMTAQTAVAQQNLIIYPARGQSQQQMQQDRLECQAWATQQSGFDPLAMPTATAPPPPGAQGSAAGGAVRGGAVGAATGLAIGSLSGDAGRGAATGAIAGGVFGGLRGNAQQQDAQRSQQQWANQQASQHMQQRNAFDRAFSACLTGRGYTVH